MTDQPRLDQSLFRRLAGNIGWLLAAALFLDAVNGFPVSRSAKSPLLWLAGLLGLLATYYVVGTVIDWVVRRDKVTDPFWLRVVHLGGLLLVLGLFVGGAYLLDQAFS